MYNKVCIHECIYDKENERCASCLRTLEEIAYTARKRMEEKLLKDKENEEYTICDTSN